MKTQIIQLNSHDDSLSVCDKLNWNKAERIMLVWPANGHLLNRPMDLNLVYRCATRLGAKLALITQDPEVKFYAYQIGIPAFNSLNSARQEEWIPNPPEKLSLPRRNQPDQLARMREDIRLHVPAWLEHPVTRLLCLCISVLAVFAMGIVILPGANIILSPRVIIQTRNLDVIIDPTSTSIILLNGSIPTYGKEVIIEGKDTLSATGQTDIPDKFAVGELRFTNNSTQTLTIPVGTIVATTGNDRVRFVTTPSDDMIINPNQSVMMPARAIMPGMSANLLANSLMLIEASSIQGMAVSNPQAMHGGTDASVASPTASDLQTLRQQLEHRLVKDALDQIQAYLPEGDQPISPTMSIVETLEETYLPALGDPGDQLELSLRVKLECQVISSGMLGDMVNSILDANMPAGYTALPDSLEITPGNDTSPTQDGRTHYIISAQRELKAEIQANQTVESIRGLSVTQALEHLSATLPLARQANILLTPSWWPRVPLLAMRIQLVFSEIP